MCLEKHEKKKYLYDTRTEINLLQIVDNGQSASNNGLLKFGLCPFKYSV